MDERFKALADPTRRQILALLRRHGEMTAGELAEHFDMGRPTVSHHFTVLKNAELVTARRDGQLIYYALNTTAVEDLLSVIWGLFADRTPGKESSS